MSRLSPWGGGGGAKTPGSRALLYSIAIVGVILALVPAGSARRRARRVDARTPRLLAGPSLRETGRVGVTSPLAHAAWRIDRAPAAQPRACPAPVVRPRTRRWRAVARGVAEREHRLRHELEKPVAALRTAASRSRAAKQQDPERGRGRAR